MVGKRMVLNKTHQHPTINQAKHRMPNAPHFVLHIGHLCSRRYAFKRFKLRKLLLLIACFLLISGCTSITLLEQPIVDHWNSVQTQKHLLAKWSGVTPSGDQISYQFNRGETCIWTYSGKEIGCKFQATPHENGYRVLIYEMAG